MQLRDSGQRKSEIPYLMQTLVGVMSVGLVILGLKLKSGSMLCGVDRFYVLCS